MNNIAGIKRHVIAPIVPLVLLALLIWLMCAPQIFQRGGMDLAITLDLVLVVPLIYVALIHKTKIPKTTVIPFIVVGVIIGSTLLPQSQQTYLSFFKTWGLPFVELAAVTLLIMKVRGAQKKYAELKTPESDFFTTLKNTCSEMLPQRVAHAFATEVGVFYYAFIDWKKRKLNAHEYSYHKESNTIVLLSVVLFIIAIETTAVHILLSKWNATATWILTILSLYTLVQFLGIAKSVLKRPIAIANKHLYLRYGVAKECTIAIDDIESVEVSTNDVELDKSTKTLALLSQLESHNVILKLKKENTFTGLYGIKSHFKTLLLSVDDVQRFAQTLREAMVNPELTMLDEKVANAIVSVKS